jgi:hypothetical protein
LRVSAPSAFPTALPALGSSPHGRHRSLRRPGRIQRLTEAHSDESAGDLLGCFYILARAALGGDGRLVKTIGDAVMIVAGTPGVASAIALRLAAAAHADPSFPAVRIGLHAEYGPGDGVEQNPH